MIQIDNEFLPGTTWQHNKTGDARRVAFYDNQTDKVHLFNPGGGELVLTPGQLENLYTETDDPAVLARFPDPSQSPKATPFDPLALNTPRPPSALALDPLPDRRRYNNGSTRTEGN